VSKEEYDAATLTIKREKKGPNKRKDYILVRKVVHIIQVRATLQVPKDHAEVLQCYTVQHDGKVDNDRYKLAEEFRDGSIFQNSLLWLIPSTVEDSSVPILPAGLELDQRAKIINIQP
jgi:hypothetical protein